MLKLMFYLISCTSLTNQLPSIYTADFKKPLGKEWIVELQPKQGSSVESRNGKLTINTKDGVTVWLDKVLQGNFQIEYTRTVLMEGQPNDRLSDLNQFWMATNPRGKEMFTKRTGAFAEYDSLQLYYVGMGGNDNKTTRFRKYDGTGEKPIINEYKDDDHLLKSGKQYHIKIIVKDGTTSFWVDDNCYFTYRDPAPLREGYFGFRSLHSRQEISDFKITSIQ
jgi:hypothetical protein